LKDLNLFHHFYPRKMFHPQRNWKLTVAPPIGEGVSVSSSKELKAAGRSLWLSDSQAFCFILKGIERDWWVTPQRWFAVDTSFILKGIERTWTVGVGIEGLANQVSSSKELKELDLLEDSSHIPPVVSSSKELKVQHYLVVSYRPQVCVSSSKELKVNSLKRIPYIYTSCFILKGIERYIVSTVPYLLHFLFHPQRNWKILLSSP